MLYLTQGVHRALRHASESCATVMGARRRTWGQFRDRVARLAAGLVAHGLERGDRVAVISLNSDWYIETYMAIWWAGGVVVPANTRWALPEHLYALQDSESRFLIVDENFTSLVAPLTEQVPISVTFFLGEGEVPAGTFSTEALIAENDPMADACGHDDDLAGLFYTGGTTGRSKGVMLSHRSLISSSLCSRATLRAGDDGIVLHSPPMFHLADAAMIINTTMVGGTHVVVPFFSPENVANAIVAERVTDILLIPTMFAMLGEYVATRTLDFSTVRLVSYGGSAISETLLQQAMELFPNAQFRQAYGQTELSPTATILTPEFHYRSAGGKSYLRSAGRAMIGIDIKIVDEDLNEISTEQVGEILVRSPGAMLGYWKQPELTRQTIVDGWVRTGDAGYLDDEGFLYVVDRVKDMVVSGGENVFSAEVENALSAHPAVAECAVIGVPDDKWGERVHAIIRLKPDAAATAEDLVAHCRTLIAGYKCPRSVELRVEPLPLSAAGKILKTDLRKPYWAEGARGVN